jgi:hypothetical protein
MENNRWIAHEAEPAQLYLRVCLKFLSHYK